MSKVTAELVQSLLDYSPETGDFRWRVSPSRNIKAGSIAGRMDRRGYWAINILNRKYASHRLAWLLTYGEWPSLNIDHINRNPSDNRICNLRNVSQKENCGNRVIPKRGRYAGTKGVSRTGNGKWQVQLRCLTDGRVKYHGLYATQAEAEGAARSLMAFDV